LGAGVHELRGQGNLYTLQGEGAQAGRAAVFCRFAGCNLWSGRESDRAAAICRFCDTDFLAWMGRAAGDSIRRRIWRRRSRGSGPRTPERNGVGAGQRFVVCTGGEPLLQLDSSLIAALHKRAFEIAVETNGTIAAPEGVNWVCVSPKAGAKLCSAAATN